MVKKLIYLFVLLFLFYKLDVTSKNAIVAENFDFSVSDKSVRICYYATIAEKTSNRSVFHSKKVTQHLKKRKQRGLKPKPYCLSKKVERYTSCVHYNPILLFNFITSINAHWDIHKRGPPNYKDL